MFNKKAFTLVELMVVVIIIAILSTIALPQYTTSMEKARTSEAVINMKAIGDALNRKYASRERYPSGTTEEIMSVLDTEFDLPKYYSVRISVNGTFNGATLTLYRSTDPIWTDTQPSLPEGTKNYYLTTVLDRGEFADKTSSCVGDVCPKIVNCLPSVVNSCVFF